MVLDLGRLQLDGKRDWNIGFRHGPEGYGYGNGEMDGSARNQDGGSNA